MLWVGVAMSVGPLPVGGVAACNEVADMHLTHRAHRGPDVHGFRLVCYGR